MLKAETPSDKGDTLLGKSLVPIIDLAGCGTEECTVKSVVNRVAQQLQKALSEKGIAILVNHGISDEKLKTAWDHLDSFCDLPTDVKELYKRPDNKNHGYIEPGRERLDGNTPELRHAFNICSLNAKTLPEEPLPGFTDHISTLATDFNALARFILQALAVSLDIPQNFFLENHSHMFSGGNDNETTLRLLYYPPIIEDDAENKIVSTATRCGKHTDYGTFTLLAQDSEGGLEVQLPGSEKWHRVGHLPGAILINCGEILSIWTQERYPALLHQVVIPEQERLRARGRHSIAFFCHPDNLTKISPNELPQNDIAENSTTNTTRKNSFKAANEKVFNAYQLVQRRFKGTYNS